MACSLSFIGLRRQFLACVYLVKGVKVVDSLGCHSSGPMNLFLKNTSSEGLTVVTVKLISDSGLIVKYCPDCHDKKTRLAKKIFDYQKAAIRTSDNEQPTIVPTRLTDKPAHTN